VTAVTTLVV
jgi:hypothetical protein